MRPYLPVVVAGYGDTKLKEILDKLKENGVAEKGDEPGKDGE